MATEGADEAGRKRKWTGPARLLLLGKSKKGSESRANRKRDSGRGGGKEGVSGAQEEVREEVEVGSGADLQTTRGSFSRGEEVKEAQGGGLRRSLKGAWRRVLSPAFTCFRRQRRPRPPEQRGESSQAARRKTRFAVLTWPPPLLRHLLTSSREESEGVGPAGAGEDAPEKWQPLIISLDADGRLWTACSPDGDTAVTLENHNDSVRRLSQVIRDEGEGGGHVLEHRSDLDNVIMEMSVQEPDAATESQLGCSGTAAEGDPQWPGPLAPEEGQTDRSCDPAESDLTCPSAAHNDLINTATPNELLDNEASPPGSSYEEEEARTTGRSNGLRRVGAGVAMVTNEHPAACCLSSADTVLVVPLIRLNSGLEGGACDWEAAPVEEASLEDSAGGGWRVEEDWEVKGGGGQDGEAELVLSAHAVVRAAMLAAVQQLLREQQNSVDHEHHQDPHRLSPNPY